MLNLAINARDAMPTRRADVRYPRVEVGSSDPDLDAGEYIDLLHQRHRVGMTRTFLERAFEPFFTHQGVGKGTGLGLSMVYWMARQSGGVARIESGTGNGRPSACSSARPAIMRASAGGDTEDHVGQTEAAVERILVIDDDPDVAPSSANRSPSRI